MDQQEKDVSNKINKDIVDIFRDANDPNFLAYCKYGNNHALAREFLRLTRCNNDAEHILKMKEGIGGLISMGVVNPCVSNKKNAKIVATFNEKFNAAKDMAELTDLFQKARKNNIEITEEFDNAFFMVHYLRKIIQNEFKETNRDMDRENDIIEFLFHSYEFIGNHWDKELQKDKNAPLINKSIEKKIVCQKKHEDFMPFIKMVEDKWHPDGKKCELSCLSATRYAIKNNKLKTNDAFIKLFTDYYGIDVANTDDKTIIKILKDIVEDYTEKHYKQFGCSINGYIRPTRNTPSQEIANQKRRAKMIGKNKNKTMSD